MEMICNMELVLLVLEIYKGVAQVEAIVQISWPFLVKKIEQYKR